MPESMLSGMKSNCKMKSLTLKYHSEEKESAYTLFETLPLKGEAIHRLVHKHRYAPCISVFMNI